MSRLSFGVNLNAEYKIDLLLFAFVSIFDAYKKNKVSVNIIL